MRKRCTRRPITALPPKGLRVMLKPETCRALAIAHHNHVDMVTRGTATVETLWEMAGAALGWCRVAEKLGMGQPEMAADLAVVKALLKRWEATRRVVYTGPELQQARAGLEVVDQLALLVDWHTACECVDWAEDRVNAIRASHQPLDTALAAQPVTP
jgi:DNA-binding transcriptional regulator YiaG